MWNVFRGLFDRQSPDRTQTSPWGKYPNPNISPNSEDNSSLITPSIRDKMLLAFDRSSRMLSVVDLFDAATDSNSDITGARRLIAHIARSYPTGNSVQDSVLLISKLHLLIKFSTKVSATHFQDNANIEKYLDRWITDRVQDKLRFRVSTVLMRARLELARRLLVLEPRELAIAKDLVSQALDLGVATSAEISSFSSDPKLKALIESHRMYFLLVSSAGSSEELTNEQVEMVAANTKSDISTTLRWALSRIEKGIASEEAYKLIETCFPKSNKYKGEGALALGENNYHLGKYVEADLWLSQARKHLSKPWIVDERLGLVKGNLHDFEGALGCFESALERNTKDAFLLSNVGLCFCALKNVVHARKLFSRALKIDPQEPNARMGFIQSYLVEGSFAEALDKCEENLAIKPNDAEVMYLKSVAQRHLGHKQQSRKTLNRVLNIDHFHEDALRDIQLIDQVTKSGIKNINNLTKLVEKSSDRLIKSSLAGLIAFDEGNLDEAIAHWNIEPLVGIRRDTLKLAISSVRESDSDMNKYKALLPEFDNPDEYYATILLHELNANTSVPSSVDYAENVYCNSVIALLNGDQDFLSGSENPKIVSLEAIENELKRVESASRIVDASLPLQSLSKETNQFLNRIKQCLTTPFDDQAIEQLLQSDTQSLLHPHEMRWSYSAIAPCDSVSSANSLPATLIRGLKGECSLEDVKNLLLQLRETELVERNSKVDFVQSIFLRSLHKMKLLKDPALLLSVVEICEELVTVDK